MPDTLLSQIKWYDPNGVTGSGDVIPQLPQLTLSGPLTFAADAAQGTLLANISANVPNGVTPTVTPNDGRIVIAGSAGAWTVVKGASASTAGNLAFTVNATGAQSVNGTAVVTAAAAVSNTFDSTGWSFDSTSFPSFDMAA